MHRIHGYTPHTNPYTLAHIHLHTHTCMLTHSINTYNTSTHPQKYTLSHTHILSCIHSLTHTLSYTLSHSSHTRSHTYIATHAHTRIHTPILCRPHDRHRKASPRSGVQFVSVVCVDVREYMGVVYMSVYSCECTCECRCTCVHASVGVRVYM